MKMFPRAILIKLTFIHAVFALIESANVASNIFVDSLHQQQHQHNLYPTSAANLILNYFKDYKHIKQLTLLLCDDSLSWQSSFMQPIQRNDNLTTASMDDGSLSPTQHLPYNDDGEQHRPEQIHNKVMHKQAFGADRYMNFQQIVNHLMRSGNFLIKGDGNIDAVGSAGIGADEDKSGNNQNSASDSENFAFSYAYSVADMMKSGDFKQGVVLDLRCHQSKHILQQASDYGLFNTSYHWLLFEAPSARLTEVEEKASTQSPPSVPSPFASLSEEFFGRLNINMNSEITLAQPQQSNSAETNTQPKYGIYDLYDVWHTGNLYGGKLNVTYLGYYLAEANVLKITLEGHTIIRRLDVHQIKIRAMCVVTNKFNESFERYLDHTYDPHLDSMNRFNYRLLTYVRDLFNFRFRVFRTNSWGYSKNGTFDGMVGALARKEMDVGGSPIFFRLERAKVIDYTARTWISRPCFVFRHPTGLMRNVFLTPFTNYVWYSILALGCLIVIIAAVFSYHEYINSGAANQLLLSDSNYIETKLQGRNRKIQHNDDSIASDGKKHRFQQIRCRQRNRHRHHQQQQWQQPHQSNDMLKAVQQNQQGVGMVSEWELHLQQQRQHRNIHRKQKQQQIIPEENVIIGILRKVFRKRFFPSPLSLSSSLQSEAVRSQQAHTKPAQTTTNYFSHNKINHKNSYLNVPDYYRCNNDDDAAIVDAIDEDCIDKNDNSNNKRIAESGAQTEQINGNENDCHYQRPFVKIKCDESTFSRCILLVLGSICQQGSAEQPQTTSRRFVIMMILLFGFFLFQFYSASIVGSLLMEKPKTIKTLRNLIDSPLKLGIEDILYNKDFFRRTTDTDALDLYNKRVRVVNPKTGEVRYNYYQPAEGMAKVQAGGFAFHSDAATFYKIIEEDFSERSICELSEIQLFPEQHMMAIVQKGSPLRKMITYGLRRTYEHGLLYYERKRWHTKKPICVRQIQPEDLKVEFASTSSAFMIWLLGIMGSICFLLLEHIAHFVGKRRHLRQIRFLR